jgi:hypothetical protein
VPRPCLRLGLEVGDADATGYHGAQLPALRWFQGRDDEVVDLVSGAQPRRAGRGRTANARD